MAVDDPDTGPRQPPAWDGAGDDPWLPERLGSLLDAGVAERSLYRVLWSELSAWLVATARRVLRGPVIDTDAVSAQAPAWSERVDRIIDDGILPIMARAYRLIFGREYGWRGRPGILRYLVDVRNRLSNIPQEVFDLIAGQIAAGVTLGEGMPKIRDRVDEILSTTKSARWKNRATVIARTESMGALNGSRSDAFLAYAEGGGEGVRMWLSTIDSRTRPSHALADGQRVGLSEPFIVGGHRLMFPGDPSGPPKEIIQCRCTILLLDAGESIDMSQRQLHGR